MVVSEYATGKVIVRIHDDFIVKATEQNDEIIRKVNEHINRCLSKRNIHTPDNSVKLKKTKERMHEQCERAKQSCLQA